MASPTIADLEQQLASLNHLKPPGASKTKVSSITNLCVSHVQEDESIVQSLARAFKKAPPSHKLGALYVIDSVVRQWIDKAKSLGQDLKVENRSEPGTYAAAVKRVTEVIPALFDDIIGCSPSEYRPKLENMIAIWEKANTFPSHLLANFRIKLREAATQSNGAVMHPSQKVAASKPSRPIGTPLGWPSAQLYSQGLLPGHEPPAPKAPDVPKSTPQSKSEDVGGLLAALAQAVPAPVSVQQQPPPPPPPLQPAAIPSQPVPQQYLPQLPPNFAALLGQQPQQQQQAPGFPGPSTTPLPYGMPSNLSFPPPVPPPSIPQNLPAAYAPPTNNPAPADPLAPLRGILPANIVNDQAKLVQALTLLQDLQKQGVPMDQWGPVLQAFNDANPAPSGNNSRAYDSHDRRRSRSPDRGRHRGSPVYGNYENQRGGESGHNDDRRGRFRQRSPLSIPRSEELAMNGRPMQPKYIALDHSLPAHCIKILSRTLFVGGANGNEEEIRDLFERFGRVQTCIANRDKRHAFVKMTTRQFAVDAKNGVEQLQTRGDAEVVRVARQTKWGVGFGPRECCDYQRGESVIPIAKLTPADVKWLTTAEYGGTGGKQLEGGMVLEEPDIEIGAGVSSKAMSKRIQPGANPSAPSKRLREDELPPQQQLLQMHQQQQQQQQGNNSGGGRRKGRKNHHHQHDYDREVSTFQRLNY
ncbi:hypothetical protein K470DRAFT_259789 [Piedraia hortae CBS 480.64]|uniref:CID domain-containing protein n=1 Tax=Piedraia hortae CBS 480.64 TaxID=1314780 RepID=A0A6A7BTJ2_9PEZI|nr:hypothetical protein K470DRAFT_259789 [Piedraia hortae CBS 480.64]